MTRPGLLKKVDAVTVRVPDLDTGLRFYADVLGHQMRWRNEATGQVALALADADTELVLTTEQNYEPNWLVESVDDTAELFRANGGKVAVAPFDIPVGRVSVVLDPFGNALVLVDLSKGTYVTDATGAVAGVVGDTRPESASG